jgi:hypothetical protein
MRLIVALVALLVSTASAWADDYQFDVSFTSTSVTSAVEYAYVLNGIPPLSPIIIFSTNPSCTFCTAYPEVVNLIQTPFASATLVQINGDAGFLDIGLYDASFNDWVWGLGPISPNITGPGTYVDSTNAVMGTPLGLYSAGQCSTLGGNFVSGSCELAVTGKVVFTDLTTAVPEPNAILLLGTAVGLSLFFLRRRLSP